MEKERRIKRANLIYKNYNIEVETKSPLEFKEHLDKQGVKVFLLVSPYRMLDTDGIKNYSWQDSSNQPKKIYPLSGKSHKLTLGGSETGKYIIYKSDRYGFNNSDDEWDKKIDITVIGDSNVHSNHLPREYGYAGRLKKLTNKSVINLGIGNNGPLFELATLKEYAKKLKPKIVLWVYCEDNDLPELKNEIKSKILSQYLNNGFSQNLIEKQNFIENNYDIFIVEKIKNTPIGKGVYKKYSEAFFRCRPDEPSGTVKENHGGVFVHYEKNRSMTPRELARLQSFPDNFIFKGTKASILKQLGNAVPCLLSDALAKNIIDIYKTI